MNVKISIVIFKIKRKSYGTNARMINVLGRVIAVQNFTIKVQLIGNVEILFVRYLMAIIFCILQILLLVMLL